MFVDELRTAYPNAKVILTNRDPDSWLQSIKRTFFVVAEWKSISLMRKWDKGSRTRLVGLRFY
jgi:hypothetical protein